MVTTKLMTVEEFMALPDDGWQYELIEGVPHRMPSAGREHGEIETEFIFQLRTHVATQGLGRIYPGDTGFFFDQNPPTVRGPDVAFVRTDRLPPGERKGFLPVVPDLVVEIVSPSDRAPHVADKIEFYLDRGVPLVWAVYPEPPRIVVHRAGQEPRELGVDDVLDGGDVLPDFRLPVADLFR